jgi:hypothetical protein
VIGHGWGVDLGFDSAESGFLELSPAARPGRLIL